ncbi:MAG: hypothetical protein ACXWV4_07180 [Flavitalea sp.]
MRMILFLIVGLSACVGSRSKDLCFERGANPHIIYPEFDISIKIPNEWQTPDSSSISDSKYLVRVMNMSNEDSSEHIYYDVNDFPEKFEGSFNDSATMKRFVNDNAIELFAPDSILSARVFDKNGWQTVVQIAVKRKEKFTFLGHIFSVYDTKQIYMLIHVESVIFEDGLKRLRCILSSYSLSN